MSATADPLTDPELLETAWDLDPLVEGEGETGVDRQLDEAVTAASEFADRYAGKVAEFDVDGLAQAMHELERIHELIGRAGSYAALRFSTDTADPTRGALLQRVQERGTELETKLLFFDLEWAALDDARADELLALPDSGDDELEFCRHHLRTVRRYRPHLLSEKEEKLLAEKSISSQSAWARLFGEVVAALRVDLDDNEVTLDVALSRLQVADRDTRKAAAEAVSETLEPGLRTRGFIYNTLVYDKSVEDRLRSYPNWLASRNLANEASDESVMALIEAVRRRYDVPRRWYALKAKLMGIPKLADYDRMAPVFQEDLTFSFGEARDLVLDTYDAFAPEAGRITRRFFEEHWIDAPVRPNKRGGAFCSYTVPSVHPYVMLNYTARRRDVLTMAHELGHGLHAALAQPQGVYHQGTPLTLAETASVFGETLVFERLLAATDNDDQRLSLLAERLDASMATVFRQMSMNRFEHLIHTRRRDEGELSTDRIGELWLESQTEMFGDSVELSPTATGSGGPTSPTSSTPRATSTPTRTGSFWRCRRIGASPRRATRSSRATWSCSRQAGSRSPEELGAIVGIDLADPGFWDSGLALIDEQLSAAEKLAEARPSP